jgi:carboxylate-amine ligase
VQRQKGFMTFPFRFGVEEEFFLVDGESLDARGLTPAAFWEDASARVPSVSKELLQSQVEIKTDPCGSSAEALAALVERRGLLAAAARAHDLAILACGTHPTMDWRDGARSPGRRYARLVRDMRMLAQRNMFCGLHVHVETPGDIDRMRLIARCVPFLPLFLALSVSSPFWGGWWTGMSCYRLTGYDELPRTGLPPSLEDDGAYDAYVAALKAADAIQDGSYVWWAIRPSARYPTIELRICDSVTDVGQAAAIAALFRCLIRRLACDGTFGPPPTPLLAAVTDENRWQVQCDGAHATLIDPYSLQPSSATDLIGLLCDDLAADGDALGETAALRTARQIPATGASADRQIAILQDALGRGETVEDALSEVKLWLASATLRPPS